MFQLDLGSQVWYALNLIGVQERYSQADTLPADVINDGQWHRVTWDLQRVAPTQTYATS